MKLSCGILLVVVMTIVDLDPTLLPEEHVKCLIDNTHLLTKPLT
jgi:hypothetical protein